MTGFDRGGMMPAVECQDCPARKATEEGGLSWQIPSPPGQKEMLREKGLWGLCRPDLANGRCCTHSAPVAHLWRPDIPAAPVAGEWGRLTEPQVDSGPARRARVETLACDPREARRRERGGTGTAATAAPYQGARGDSRADPEGDAGAAEAAGMIRGRGPALRRPGLAFLLRPDPNKAVSHAAEQYPWSVGLR